MTFFAKWQHVIFIFCLGIGDVSGNILRVCNYIMNAIFYDIFDSHEPSEKQDCSKYIHRSARIVVAIVMNTKLLRQIPDLW